MKSLDSPEQAYFVPNLTRAIFHRSIEPCVLIVRVLAVSIVRPIAKIQFSSGACRWAPFDVLASSRSALEQKLKSIYELRK